MPSVPKKRWERFIASLRLEKKIEFNAGDVGLNGGFAVRENASANPTTTDQILRFGGSTSLSMQWPTDNEGDGDAEDRFARMEKLIQKAMKRMTHGSGKKGNKGGGTATGTSG